MSAIHHTDIIVIGGGSAGIAAAVAAAKKGLQVVIIEQNEFLGGKATAAEVGTVCGLYHFSNSITSTYLVKGFAKEFAEKLKLQSNSSPLHSPEGLHYLPYNIHAFKNICSTLVSENNILVYYNATLANVTFEKDKITSVLILVQNKAVIIHVKSVIDCSGDGAIGQLAGLPLVKSKQYQAAAQIFTMQGVTEKNEFTLSLAIMKALRAAIHNQLLEDFFDRVYIVQGSLRNNLVSLKIGIPKEVTLEPNNIQELKFVAHNMIKKLVPFLIQSIDAFKNAQLEHIAPEVGIRVGFRSMGKFILNGENVLQCRKFDDAIANSSWPIEIWEQNRRVKMQYLKQEEYYQVPSRCLQSNTIINLFFGGRTISADDEAIASSRVMGTCLQTGYAAGCMASAVVLQKNMDEIVKEIQTLQL